MSFYDDSTLLFLAAGAVYKDGKINTIKPAAPNPRAPLYVTRGANLSATRVDSNGLIEKGRENLLLQSNQFDTTWSKTNTNPLGGQSGYDGTNDAWKIEADTASTTLITQGVSISGVMTASIYAKAGATDWFRFSINDSGVNTRAWFDLSGSGAVGTTAGNIIDTKIESVGNGYFRCSITFNATAATLLLFLADGNGTLNPDAGDYIYIQDAQLEQGLVATEYIESGATTGLAGILEDSPRFNYPIGGSSPHLLLEPSRTNLLSNSEYLEGNTEFKILGSSVTFADYTETSPDGNENALRVLEAEGNGNHNWYYDNIGGLTNGTTYCISFFAKSIRGRNIRFDEGAVGINMQGIIDLSDGSILQDTHNNVSVESYGNGWYRISAVGAMNGTSQRIIFNSADGTSTSFEGNTTSGVSLWGVQIEEGSYPTSYIPNHSGGSVTRENEICQNTDIDTVTNMSTDECTVFFDVDLPQGREGSIALFRFWKAGNTTRWGIKGNYEPSPIMSIEGTGTISNSNTTNLSVGRHKIAVRWTNGTADVFIDGAEVSALSTTDSGAPTSFYKLQLLSQGYRHLVHQFIVLTSSWDDLDCRVLTGLTDYYASFSEMATALNYTIYE